MGTVRWRSYANFAIDLEYFDAPSSVAGTIFTGCQDCFSPSAVVNGQGVVSVGAIARSDGFVSAPADCTVVINWMDGCAAVTTNRTTIWTCPTARRDVADFVTSSRRCWRAAGTLGKIHSRDC